MSVDSLERLFVEELRDLYSAETQITKALPKMVSAASSKDVEKALENHLRETEGRIERLIQIVNMLGTNPKGRTCDRTCEGMEGVLDEGPSMLKEAKQGVVPDAALISAPPASGTLRDGGLRHGPDLCPAAGAEPVRCFTGRSRLRRRRPPSRN